jgi:Uma2 family endonuclease
LESLLQASSYKIFYTFADYLTWADDKTRELIDGFIKMMSKPKPVHQGISCSLAAELLYAVKKHKGKCKVYPEIDVRLPKNGEREDDKIYTVVSPDISVVCDPTKIDDNGCLGAPDMIVEIQSFSTAKYDLTTKYNLYESSGVREYWVVYPLEKGIEVFLLQSDGKYDNGTRYEMGMIPVHIFDGHEIDFRDIF